MMVAVTRSLFSLSHTIHHLNLFSSDATLIGFLANLIPWVSVGSGIDLMATNGGSFAFGYNNLATFIFVVSMLFTYHFFFGQTNKSIT